MPAAVVWWLGENERTREQCARYREKANIRVQQPIFANFPFSGVGWRSRAYVNTLAPFLRCRCCCAARALCVFRYLISLPLLRSSALLSSVCAVNVTKEALLVELRFSLPLSFSSSLEG